MVEWMLEDAGRAHDLRSVVLRLFSNVAGADPPRPRPASRRRRRPILIKVAVQAALRPPRFMSTCSATDYPTARTAPALRDYIHVTDLGGRPIWPRLAYLPRTAGASLTCNCGYGRGLFGAGSGSTW